MHPGDVLRRLREKSGVSVEEAARAIQKPADRLSAAEAGKLMLAKPDMRKLLDFYNASQRTRTVLWLGYLERTGAGAGTAVCGMFKELVQKAFDEWVDAGSQDPAQLLLLLDRRIDQLKEVIR